MKFQHTWVGEIQLVEPFQWPIGSFVVSMIDMALGKDADMEAVVFRSKTSKQSLLECQSSPYFTIMVVEEFSKAM